MAFTINDGVLEKYTEEAGITEVVIPEGVKKIESGVFHESGMTSVYIPDTVRTIEGGAFGGCKQLRTVRLSEQLEKLGSVVFCGCVSLEKIVIPDSVEQIHFKAFGDCERLRDVTLPIGLSHCCSTAFEGTPWLEKYMEEHEFLVVG